MNSIVRFLMNLFFALRYFVGFTIDWLEQFSRLLLLPFRQALLSVVLHRWRLLQILPGIVIAITAVAMAFVAHTKSKAVIAQRYLDAGRRALADNDLAAANLYYRRVAYDDEQSVGAQLGLATVAMKQDNPAAARRWIQRVARPDRQGDPAAHLWLAKDIVAQPGTRTPEEIDILLGHLQHVVAVQPHHAEAGALLAQIYVERGRLPESAQCLERLYEVHPQFGLNLGRIYGKMGDQPRARSRLQGAAAWFREVAVKDPDNVSARLFWAECLLLLKDFTEARNTLVAGLSRSGNAAYRPAIIKVLVAESDAARQGDKPDMGRAMELLDAAMKLDPGNPLVLNRWTLIVAAPGPQREQVAAALNDLIIQGKASARVHLLLGVIAAYDEDHEKASQHFQLGLAREPQMATLLNNFAWSLARADPPDTERALELANRAVAAAPENAEFRETRGQILALLSRWEEAIVDLETVLPVMQDRDQVRNTLAHAYEALGRQDLADGYRKAILEGRRTEARTNKHENP